MVCLQRDATDHLVTNIFQNIKNTYAQGADLGEQVGKVMIVKPHVRAQASRHKNGNSHHLHQNRRNMALVRAAVKAHDRLAQELVDGKGNKNELCNRQYRLQFKQFVPVEVNGIPAKEVVGVQL